MHRLQVTKFWLTLYTVLIIGFLIYLPIVLLIVFTMAAQAMTRYRYRGRSVFTGYIAIPLVMPWLLLGIALLLFFNFVGIPLSLFTVILSHISFDVPLVAVIVAARLYQVDPSLEEAARDLGAGPIASLLPISSLGLTSPFPSGSGLHSNSPKIVPSSMLSPASLLWWRFLSSIWPNDCDGEREKGGCCSEK